MLFPDLGNGSGSGLQAEPLKLVSTGPVGRVSGPPSTDVSLDGGIQIMRLQVGETKLASSRLQVALSTRRVAGDCTGGTWLAFCDLSS